MSLTAWLTLVGICCAGAVSPGPSLVLILRQTISSSRHGLAASWAHAIGIGLYATAAGLGLGALFASHPNLQSAIRWGGAAYLTWIGANALFSKGTSPVSENANSENPPVLVAAKQGFGMALVNPKVILSFAAVFSQLIDGPMRASTVAIMSSTAMLVDGVWYSIVVLGLSRTPLLQRIRTNSVWADRLMGAILIAVAVVVLLIH